MGQIDNLREIMGTNPKQQVPLETAFFEGVRGIEVRLLDGPKNPYRSIFDMATSTWGSTVFKWEQVSSEARFMVVKAVLDFQSLPNAMESCSFAFGVERCSRSAFDQIARARIGAVFSSMGWRDNDHSDIGFRVPQSIWDDLESRTNFQHLCIIAKQEYHRLVSKGASSWQDARATLPISACHNFTMAMNYMALRNFGNTRLKFCEQADTVAVAWLVRERMLEQYPLLGSYMRPGCDWTGVCQYHKEYMMSEAFGCLFKECGRNICKNADQYASFNFSCTSKKQLESQLVITIPGSGESMPVLKYQDLSNRDIALFQES